MNDKIPVFFLVKNRALGDSIMGLGSVQYLRKLYPESKIIYAVPAWVAPLYSQVQTDADIIYPLRLNSLSDIASLFTDLLNMGVTAIHEMHQTGRGSKIFSIYSYLKKIPYTFHNHHLKNGTKVIDQGIIKKLIQRDLDGVYSFFSTDRVIPNFLDYQPKMKNAHKAKKYNRIILGVVATRKTKMWPLSSYIELSKLILEKYPNYEIVIPLSLSQEDILLKKELLLLGLPSNTSIAHWSMDKLAEEFESSSYYIGNDTGLKHLAVATNLKTFTFFGPEPASEWHPYNENDHKYFYEKNLSCRTRYNHYCGLSFCDLGDKKMQCLTIFTHQDVFKEIEKSLNSFIH